MVGKLMTSVALICLATSAFADGPGAPAPETPVAAPVQSPSSDWSGLYFGGQIGNADVDISAAGAPISSGSGLTYGVHAGYNWDFGTVVAGLEGDISMGSFELTGLGTDEFDRLSHLKAKLGYDAGNLLPYVAAGMAWLDTDGGTSMDGTAYGIGVDYRLSPKMSAGLEVLWHDLDDGASGGFTADPVTANARLSFHF